MVYFQKVFESLVWKYILQSRGNMPERLAKLGVQTHTKVHHLSSPVSLKKYVRRTLKINFTSLKI